VVPRVTGAVKMVTVPFWPPYPVDGNPEILAAVGGQVLFAVDDGVHGRELWVSDGAAAGTKLVGELNPGKGDGVAADLSPWGDGHSAAATLTPTGKAAGQFTLSAWHTYADPGTYPVMIRVTADAKTVLSIDTAATVADAKWYAGRVAARVTAGQPFAGAVATI